MFYLSKQWGSIRGGCSYTEEKAVYIIIIHGKTVQWKTRKQSCSIINIQYTIYIYIYIYIYMRSLKRSNLIKQKQPFCCLESLCFWLSFICTWNDLEICFIIYFLYSKWFCKYFMVSSQMIKVRVAIGHYCLLDRTKNTQIV